jgi:hypothetical protein
MSAQSREPDPSGPFIDVSPYVAAIPTEDMDDHVFSDGRAVYSRVMNERWLHVLFGCEEPNVFMVIVADLQTLTIRGHHLLDLNVEYGLRDPE